MNPLLIASTLPSRIPDYVNLIDAQFREAMKVNLVKQRTALEAIAINPDAPNMENTTIAQELGSAILERTGLTFWVMKTADTNEQCTAVEMVLVPKLAEHGNAILLGRRLYDRLVTFRARAEVMEVSLDEQGRYRLEEHICEFERSGVSLDSDAQQRLRELNMELTGLSVALEQALVGDRNAAAVLITDPAELVGLGEDGTTTAQQATQDHEQGGWLIELTSTTGQPVLESLANRDLCRRILEVSLR